MTKQQEAWRKRQRVVLTALRKASKRNRTAVAEHAELEYWQVVRLETGKARLPADLIPALARGYDTTPEAIITALELIPAQTWSPRAAMEAVGYIDPRRIDQVEADVMGKPEKAQRARVDAEIELGPDPAARSAHETHTDGRRTG